MSEHVPLFSSSREALSFAMNYSAASIKPPTMNRLLNEGQPPANWLEAPTKRSVHPGAAMKTGLDGAATAGQVLSHYNKLHPVYRLVLLCRVLTPRLACSCKSPCCAGYKINPEWAAGVDATCLLLKVEAELSKKKGKKGLSTHPVMRRALVEKYFDHKRRFVVTEIAESCEVTEATVYAHQKPILHYLDDSEKTGWTKLDEALCGAGIVGAQA